MIRASAGVWINYATTLIFQSYFASRFGSGPAATAFVVVFGMAVVLVAFTATAVRNVIQPRLIMPGGEFARQPVRVMWALMGIFVTLATVLALAPAPVAGLVAERAGFAEELVIDLVRLTVAFSFVQLVGAVLQVINLARGRRLLPSAVLAFPSIGAIGYLMLFPSGGVRGVYLGLIAGSLVQVATLAVAVGPVRIVDQSYPNLWRTTFATMGAVSVNSIVPPVERLMASLDSSAGGAQYFYASRTLAVVQSLIVGGAVLTTLSQWSRLFSSGKSERLRRSLAATAVLGTVLLLVAASGAIVAGRDLVALVFQRGDFTPEDTRIVTDILTIALVGFCAEGLGLLVNQGILAALRNDVTVAIGLCSVAVRLGLIVALAHVWGPYGVAAAYSVTSVFSLALQLWWSGRIVGWVDDPVPGVAAAAAVAAVALASAVTLRLTLPDESVAAGGALVVIVGGLFLVLRRKLMSLYHAA